MKNFGEFFNDQVETAGTIILSRTQDMDETKLAEVVALLREHNPNAAIITTPWDEISGDVILSAMAHHSLAEELMAEAASHPYDEDDDDECDDPACSCHHHHDHDEDEEHEHHHHHHDHDEDEEHEHHHHDHDEDEEHEHHHHDHDEDEEHEHHHHDHDEDEEHEHHHHHDHDHHHHHHHHGHDADEVFVSWGQETPKKFTAEELRTALEALDTGAYGAVLRAKGIVPATDGTWLHFDMVPGEFDVRTGSADYTGRLCVIGSGLKEDQLPGVFGL
jgi:G3E family GTPase